MVDIQITAASVTNILSPVSARQGPGHSWIGCCTLFSQQAEVVQQTDISQAEVGQQAGSVIRRVPTSSLHQLVESLSVSP